MRERFFSCSLSRVMRISTVVCVVLEVGVIVAFTIMGALRADASRWIMFGVACLTVAILIVPLLFAPRRYRVSAEGVRVCRLGYDVVIPVGEIREMAIAAPGDLKGTIRTCGVGGYFGAWGMFWNPTLKSFWAWMTRSDTAVVMRKVKGTTVVVSPDEPAAFVRAWETFTTETQRAQRGSL